MSFDMKSPRTILIIEIAAGVVGGLVLGLPILIVAGVVLRLSPTDGMLFAGLAYPIGAAVGVWLVGRRLLGRGRLWHALVGAFVPVMILTLMFAEASVNAL